MAAVQRTVKNDIFSSNIAGEILNTTYKCFITTLILNIGAYFHITKIGEGGKGKEKKITL